VAQAGKKPACYIFLNDKGGTGKTLSCHLMALSILDWGERVRILECEKQGRLKGIFQSLVDFHPMDAGGKPGDVEPSGPRRGYWDRVAGSIGSSAPVCLLDLGAGFTSPFLRWAEHGGTEKFLEVAEPTFLMVATINRDSLEIGFENLLDAGRLFPEMRRVVLKNERDGDFRQWAGIYEAARKSINREGREIEEIVLPGCTAPHWAYFQNMGRLDEVALMDAGRFARIIQQPDGVAANSLYILTRWLQAATGTFDGILRSKLSEPDRNGLRFPFHDLGGRVQDSREAGRGGEAA